MHKLMNNAAYGKRMEKFWNRFDIKLVSNKKDYLKWTCKASYLWHKMFDNDLVAICKSKFILTLKIHWNVYFAIKRSINVGCLLWLH